MMLLVLTAGLAAGCIAVNGDKILARDLPQAVPEFHALDGDHALGYAPAPGGRRLFSRRELARVLARPDLVAALPESVCVERAMRVLSKEQVREAMQASLNGHDIRLELLDFARNPVPAGAVVFQRAGLPVPAQPFPVSAVTWRGFVRYSTTGTVPIWARVKLSSKRERVLAAENLAAGELIRPGQLRVEVREEFPFSSARAIKMSEVAGRVPKRSIRSGTAVTESALALAREVASGDVVLVEVTSGAARLKTQAAAESSGSVGDVITLRNPQTGRRFRGVVRRKGEVSVEADHSEFVMRSCGGIDCGKSGSGR